MIQRPVLQDVVRAIAPPARRDSLLRMKKLWIQYSRLFVLSRFEVSAPGSQSAAVPSLPVDEFSALNTLIHGLGARWSQEARSIQFDFEFKAVEQERRRVAKELHDEILPSLARLIRSIQSRNEDPVNASLVHELHTTVGAFRDLLSELHPVDLEELGLVPALDNICARYARMTGRFVVFAEEVEDCKLSDLQQLCVFRAMQAVLKMFTESQNDLLIVNFERILDDNVITVRCIDKQVSSAEWLSAEKRDFDAFEAWCTMAGARVEIGTSYRDEFPCDLVISIEQNKPGHEEFTGLLGELEQVRLAELDSILAQAKAEWTSIIDRDRALFENLAVETERKRISEDINRLILPHLENIDHLAHQSRDDLLIQDVNERMRSINDSVGGVMTDLHPRLLAESGFFPSIRTLVDRFRRASLIETTIISNLSSDQIEISLDAKFAIYRVTQEALNNIEKHSFATHALVIVKRVGYQLVVCIEDNGKGFQGSTNSLSRGLKNIKERASDIGAKVAWEKSTSFATGTLVTISLHCASNT